MKIVGVTDYTNQTPPRYFGWEKCLSSTPVKMIKYLSNVHKIDGAHLKCVNNHYAKYEYKETKTVEVTDYTNQTPSKHFWMEKCLSSKPLKIEKIFMKCAQNRRCTSCKV